MPSHTARAITTATTLLTGVGTRLPHSLAVGQRAAQIVQHWPDLDPDLVTAAGYLHDIGYSPTLHRTGWHPLDGAIWLADHDYPTELCSLVLWHSAAWHEGRLRGLYDQAVDQGGPARHTAADAVIAAADLQTSPTGHPMTIDERITEIRTRYAPDDLVIQALDLAETDWRRLVSLANAGPATTTPVDH